MAEKARASESLSAKVKACAASRFGKPCSGAGNNEGTKHGARGRRARSWSCRWSSDLIENADAPVEADEIGAAAEEHVLAVVDDFVDAGMQVGARAPAEVAAALDELHPEPASARAQAALMPATPPPMTVTVVRFVLRSRASVPQGLCFNGEVKSRSFAPLPRTILVRRAPSMLRSG